MNKAAPLLFFAHLIALWLLIPLPARPDSPTRLQSWEPLAWRAEDYIPPNPEAFFPDDSQAGKQLDRLLSAPDRNQRSDREILETVRQGFRQTSQHRTLILAWIGNRSIWNQEPQNPYAIELMYHALPLETHYANYFGLSVVREKTANILRTLAALAMEGDAEEIRRMTWGLGQKQESIIPYFESYLLSKDAAERTRADLLIRHFRGELDYGEVARIRAREKKEKEFAQELPEWRSALEEGTSAERLVALQKIRRNGAGFLLGRDFLQPMEKAAQDEEPAVRALVAELAGRRFVQEEEHAPARAEELLLKLAGDSAREVRHRAVEDGLLKIGDKSEKNIDRLVAVALTDHEPQLHGALINTFRKFTGEEREHLGAALEEWAEPAAAEPHTGAALYYLYLRTFDSPPPTGWELRSFAGEYPDGLNVVPVLPRGDYEPSDAEELWAEIQKLVGGRFPVRRFLQKDSGKGVSLLVSVDNEAAARMLEAELKEAKTLQPGDPQVISPEVQLYAEEVMSRR